MKHKDYLRIYCKEHGAFDYDHPQMSVGTMLALIGYMEKVKLELIKTIDMSSEDYYKGFGK